MLDAKLVALTGVLTFSIILAASISYVNEQTELRDARGPLDQLAGSQYDAPYHDQVDFVCSGVVAEFAQSDETPSDHPNCVLDICSSFMSGEINVDTKLLTDCGDNTYVSVSFNDIVGSEDWFLRGLSDPQCPASATEEICSARERSVDGVSVGEDCSAMVPYIATTIAVEHWRYVNKKHMEAFHRAFEAICADPALEFGCGEARNGFKPTPSMEKFSVECPDDLGIAVFDFPTLLLELDAIVLANGGEDEVKALLYGKCSTDRRLKEDDTIVPFNKPFSPSAYHRAKAANSECTKVLPDVTCENIDDFAATDCTEDQKEALEAQKTECIGSPCNVQIRAHQDVDVENMDCESIRETLTDTCSDEEREMVANMVTICDKEDASYSAPECVAASADACAEGADASCSAEDKVIVADFCAEDDGEDEGNRRSLKAMLRSKSAEAQRSREMFDFLEDEEDSADIDTVEGSVRDRKLWGGSRRRRWHGHWPHAHWPHMHWPHHHCPHDHVTVPPDCPGCFVRDGNACFGRCGPGCKRWNACGCEHSKNGIGNWDGNDKPGWEKTTNCDGGQTGWKSDGYRGNPMNCGGGAHRACVWHDSYCGQSMLHWHCLSLIFSANAGAAEGARGQAVSYGETCGNGVTRGSHHPNWKPFGVPGWIVRALTFSGPQYQNIPAAGVHGWGKDSKHRMGECDVCDRFNWGPGTRGSTTRGSGARCSSSWWDFASLFSDCSSHRFSGN